MENKNSISSIHASSFTLSLSLSNFYIFSFFFFPFDDRESVEPALFRDTAHVLGISRAIFR